MYIYTNFFQCFSFADHKQCIAALLSIFLTQTSLLWEVSVFSAAYPRESLRHLRGTKFAPSAGDDCSIQTLSASIKKWKEQPHPTKSLQMQDI